MQIVARLKHSKDGRPRCKECTQSRHQQSACQQPASRKPRHRPGMAQGPAPRRQGSRWCDGSERQHGQQPCWCMLGPHRRAAMCGHTDEPTGP
eukprot:362563-Chlamydomonas_euryale.AAC.4